MNIPDKKIDVLGVSLYVTDKFCYKEVKQLDYEGNCSGPSSRVGTTRMSVQASFSVFAM